MGSKQQSSYRHFTAGINHIPMEMLRKRIKKATPRILTPNEQSKRIRVFLNGDQQFEGALILIRPQQNMHSVLDEIQEKTRCAKPLTCLYDLDGRSVTSFGKLVHSGSYVAASGAFKKTNYNTGRSKPPWKNVRNPRGKRISDIDLIQTASTNDTVYSTNSDEEAETWRREVSKKKDKSETESFVTTRPKIRNDKIKSFDKPVSSSEISNISSREESKVTSCVADTDIDVLKLLTLSDDANSRNKQLTPKSFVKISGSHQQREVTVIYGKDKTKLVVRPDHYIDEIIRLCCCALGLQEYSNHQLLLQGKKLHHTSQLFDSHCENKALYLSKVSTNPSEKIQTEPQSETVAMKLQWIFGGNLKSDVCITDDGELIYTSGTLVIVHDVDKSKQRFYTGHTEDVTCLSLYEKKALIASGQRQSVGIKDHETMAEAHIRIWNLENLAVTSQFGHGLLGVSVLKVEFSITNLWIAVLDFDHLSLWDWEQETMLSRLQGSYQATMITKFVEEDSYLITSSAQHLTLWEIASNGDISKSHKSFASGQTDPITSIISSFDNDLISGDMAGKITIWQTDVFKGYTQSLNLRCKKLFYAQSENRTYHAFNSSSKRDSDPNRRIAKANLDFLAQKQNNGVTAMCMLSDGTLVTGDAKGSLYAWDILRKCVSAKAVKKICENYVDLIFRRKQDSDEMICLCDNSFAIEGNFLTSWRKMRMGHPAKIVSMAPLADDAYVCAGDVKGNLLCWNVQTMETKWESTMQFEISCLDVFEVFDIVMTGTKKGQLVVVSSVDGSLLCSRNLISPVSCLRFSGRGSEKATPFVAVATLDRNVTIFYVLESGRAYVTKCVIQTYDVAQAMDWACDWKSLRLKSENGVTAWIIDSKKNEHTSASEDKSLWLTRSCSFDRAVTCQYAATRSSLRCAGYNNGKIQVWRNEMLLGDFKCSTDCITSICLTSRLEVLCSGGSNASPFFAKWHLTSG